MNSLLKAYRSCFVVDVQISTEKIQIVDSGRNRFFISLKDSDAVQSFKEWFKDIFLKAKTQCVTVFQYEMRPEEKDSDIEETYILKFLTQKQDQIEMKDLCEM